MYWALWFRTISSLEFKNGVNYQIIVTTKISQLLNRVTKISHKKKLVQDLWGWNCLICFHWSDVNQVRVLKPKLSSQPTYFKLYTLITSLSNHPVRIIKLWMPGLIQIWVWSARKNKIFFFSFICFFSTSIEIWF